jgi:hypothetical protein
MVARDVSFFSEISAEAKRVSSPVREEWERSKVRQAAAELRPAPKVKRQRKTRAAVVAVTKEEQTIARAEWAVQQTKEAKRPAQPAAQPAGPVRKTSRWAAMELD